MNKISPKFNEAINFLNSLRLPDTEIRKLYSEETNFIVERANELKIPYVKEYIDFIKNNKKEKIEQCSK